MEEQKQCVECGEGLSPDQTTCPKCGVEQPVKWLTWLVYILLALFVIGAVYRLLVP